MLDPNPAAPALRNPDRRQPHAVVIGSGFGGLAAAVRLGAKGYRVAVLEQLDAPGGRAYVYRQDGFTFDAGPTIVTAPFLFEELWRLCGRKLSDDVTLVPVSPFYRIRFQDGAHFDYSGDPAAMRAEIARFSPGDVGGYDGYMKASEEIFKVGFEQLGDVPFGKWTDMARIAPEMIRLSSYRSVYSLVSKFFRDPKLRVVFSFHPLLIGGNPFTASSIYCLIAFLERRWGVHFALGGTGRLVDGLVKLIEGQGGRVLCGHKVSEILVGNGAACGVKLASGETVKADIVVSNADSAWTYRHLLPASARSRWTDRRIERARYSMSLFVWYFGTRRQYPELPHHTILLGPRYKELLTDIFERKFSPTISACICTVRPPPIRRSRLTGCDAFYVLSPVPHLQSGTDWRVTAEKYRQAIARELGNTLLPDLENQIASSRMLTPQDFQDRLSSFRGAAFGLEPVLTQSAWFRPHNRSEDIDRLYLVGAGTHPGAGLPGVLSSARVLDSLVPDAHSFTRPDLVTP